MKKQFYFSQSAKYSAILVRDQKHGEIEVNACKPVHVASVYILRITYKGIATEHRYSQLS